MKNHPTLSIVISAALAVIALTLPLASHADSTSPDTTAALASAISYLRSKPLGPWSVMALSAAGAAPSAASTSAALASMTTSTAIELEAPILAITATGNDPHTFLGEDLVAELENFYSTTTGELGDTSTLNDDVFGLLAFNAARVSSSDPTVIGVRNFLIAHQNSSDGGFSYAVGSTSDTNTTAAAVMALLATGSNASNTPITKAMDYLKSAQNADGGFSYDPASPYGTSTDASSDAWIISAMNALGESPTSSMWTTASGTDPLTNMLTLQDATAGFFAYQAGSGEDGFSPVTTSYAVIALAGKHLPVAVWTPNDNAAPAPTSTTATSTDSATSTASTTVTSPAPTVVNVGSTGGGGGGSSAIQISYRIEGPTSTLCAGTGPAATAMDALSDAQSSCGVSYHVQQYSFGPYVDRIGDLSAQGSNGWTYSVNSTSPAVGAADYRVQQNDAVVWRYGWASSEPLPPTAPAPTTSGALGGGGGNANNPIASSTSISSEQPAFNGGEVLGASTTDQAIDLNTLEQKLVALEFKANACRFSFHNNLHQGMNSSEVRDLQTVLDYSESTSIAASGPGSPGHTTYYFGAGTKRAVAAFQNIFADRILTPNGLASGNGYVGSATRSVLNELCTQ